MTLSGVRPGDIVEVDIKGRRFHAIVTQVLPIGAELAGGRLVIAPIDRRITYTRARSREVIGHWRKSRQAPRRARTQETSDVA